MKQNRVHMLGETRYIHGKTPVVIFAFLGYKKSGNLSDRYFVVEIQENATINKKMYFKGDKIPMNSRNLYPNKGVKV